MVHDIAGVASVQAELLRAAGHEVDQIALPAHGATWRWPAKGLALPVRLLAFAPVVQRIRGGGYDVVHIHYLSQGIVGVLARRPFFAQAHGSDLHVNTRNVAYRRLTTAVVKAARAVFYVTPNLRQYLEGYHTPLVYLPNPVAVSATAGAAPAPSQIRRAVIFTRLHQVKGVDLIFPAVEALAEDGVEITALEYGPLAREYMARYGRWVRFDRPVPHSQVGDYLASFDLMIGQMRQGIIGLSEIEALAAGRPVIAALDGRFYPDDPPPVIAAAGPDEIVAAVRRLRHERDELARLAAAGREWAERNHGYQQHLQKLESAYFGPSRNRTLPG